MKKLPILTVERCTGACRGKQLQEVELRHPKTWDKSTRQKEKVKRKKFLVGAEVRGKLVFGITNFPLLFGKYYSIKTIKNQEEILLESGRFWGRGNLLFSIYDLLLRIKVRGKKGRRSGDR